MDDDKRQQILEVAAGILERDGAAGLSTRSVAAAAGIRAASLYQLFGDKDGLLAALAIHAFDLYLAGKRNVVRTDDPVADMRRSWDTHVAFGLRHPAFYLLMYGADRPGRRPPAAAEAHDLLLKFFDRAAAAGRLRVPPELAANLCLAAIVGVTLSLIGVSETDRDPEVSPRMRDTLIASLTTDPPVVADGAGVGPRALALDAALTAAEDGAMPLRPAEAALLRDWLHRLAVSAP